MTDFEETFDFPLAADKDPISSFEAADKVRESGRLNEQEQVVYDALKRFPGHTSKRLAALSGLNRSVVARRLPGLRDKKKARHCPEEYCMTWGCKVDCKNAKKYMKKDIGDTVKSMRWWLI